MLAITVENLEVRAIIGVHEFERQFAQLLQITICVEGDWHRAIETDHVADALDYTQLADLASNVLQNGRFQLLETAAAKLLEACQKIHGVKKCCVEVVKPGAIPDARGVSVSATMP